MTFINTDCLKHENNRCLSVEKGTEELNLKAFDKGYDYGIEILKKKGN